MLTILLFNATSKMNLKKKKNRLQSTNLIAQILRLKDIKKNLSNMNILWMSESTSEFMFDELLWFIFKSTRNG